MAIKRLGKGLSALIPDTFQMEEGEGKRLMEIPLDEIQPNPYQPRDIDRSAVGDLVASIKTSGVINPISVHGVDGGYQLIAGERRWRAARAAGLTHIPAVLFERKTRQELLEMAIIENVQRADLNPVEQATGYRRLMEECRLTQQEVAGRVGVDRATVANLVRLLSLEEPILEMLRDGRLTAGHGRAVLAVKDGRARLAFARRVVAEGMSVRQVEAAAAATGPPKGSAARPPARRAITPEIRHLEERLQHALGTKVTIQSRGSRGMIRIEYYSAEDCARVVDCIAQTEKDL